MAALKDRYLRQVLAGEVVPDKTKLTDKNGLYLLVKQLSKGGVGLYWRFDFQYAGKRKTLSLGTFPLVSITAARERLLEAKLNLSKGINPSVEREAAKAQKVSPDTFKSLAEEWLARKDGGVGPERHDAITSKLERYVYPSIGSKAVQEVIPKDVVSILRKVDGLGYPVAARETISIIGSVFRYAMATGAADRNPADLDLVALIKPHVKQHHPTITEPARIGELLRKIDGYHGHAATRYALQLMPLLMLRQGELRSTRWDEIDWEAKTLTIPAMRMKLRVHLKEANREQDRHVVPLSTQAIAIFRQLHEISGMFEHCFPNQRNPRSFMSSNTIGGALLRIGISGDELTPHGFRSMASTLLNEMAWNPDAIERQLAHVERNTVRRSYNHGTYLDERRGNASGLG